MPTVVWLAFTPFQNNTVSWDDTYSVYGTGTSIVTGNTISINSTESAMLGFLYTISGGTFTAAPYSNGISTFNIANQQSSSYNFGLTQQATINGEKSINTPVNCIPVLYNQQAMFTPSETVYIFLSSCATGGVFIPIQPSSALAVPLTKKQSATIEFNDATNSFYILS